MSHLKTFLSPCRFDLMAKYLYVKSKDKNLNTTFFRELYHQHIITFNGCKEFPDKTIDEKGITKNNINDFLNSFDNLIANIKNEGYNHIFPIPIGKNGVIINGAHRLITSYYYNIFPKTININQKGSESYHYDFFLNRKGKPKLEEKYADTMALEYIKHNENVRTMVIYPVAFDKKDLHEILEVINKYGYIYYQKIIQLNNNGINNLIKEIYRGERWIGGMFPKGWSPGGKAKLCVNTNNPLVYISIVMNDLNKCIELKEKCRSLYNLGKHSLHMSDYTSDTYRISSSLLNINSIEFLNQTNDIDSNKKELLMDYFNNNENNKNDILITEVNDDKINYIKTNEDDEKLYNPINFYYFNGYKIYKNIKLCVCDR